MQIALDLPPVSSLEAGPLISSQVRSPKLNRLIKKHARSKRMGLPSAFSDGAYSLTGKGSEPDGIYKSPGTALGTQNLPKNSP